MQTIYSKKNYIERENEQISANIRAVMETCVPLNIYCAMEHGVWGIWIDVDKIKYLVDPIDLVDSLFEDGNYYMLETYHATENECRTVFVHKDDYCYSWRFECGVSKDPHPIYINYQEYVEKIKTCVEALYAAWMSDKPVAYDKFDFDREKLGIAVEQMNVSAVMPNYYRLMTSLVRQEQFVFEIASTEKYTIGIGDRKYTTFLTHWDNNYDTIRHQLETFVHNYEDMETTIKLSFDLSDLVLKIKHVRVLDKIDESEVGYGFKYKDFALVEIQPNQFVYGSILKGYCDLKQTLKTLYEGLLTLALAHDVEPRYHHEPSQIEAYNMFKSPLIERYIADLKSSSRKAELRQIHIKRILMMIPDYDEVITDTEGNHIDIDGDDGNIDDLYDKEGKPFMIEGLKEWQTEIEPVVIEGAVGRTVDSFDWKNYHERGLVLAHELRKKLSCDFDLWYKAPVEDKSGLITRPIYIYEKTLPNEGDN